MLSPLLLFLAGLVLFLEEDHYVSDDFLSVLRLIEVERTTRYPNCDIICLGTYLKSYNYNRDHKTVSFFDGQFEADVEKPLVITSHFICSHLTKKSFLYMLYEIIYGLKILRQKHPTVSKMNMMPQLSKQYLNGDILNGDFRC